MKWEVINTKTSTSCVSINPLDASPVYTDEDDLPEARGMGNFIILPDRRMFLVNGASYGSEGYGWQNWTQGIVDPLAHFPSALTVLLQANRMRATRSTFPLIITIQLLLVSAGTTTFPLRLSIACTILLRHYSQMEACS